ncbi:hypothetical protein CAC42_7330 [Sphaceloma murrayae]|uniref:SH3 domain-containing protein n=1 Tax=Sphaceloma murrayae TaxID=2082308 RepID=A0A2K1QWP9_9PEZI|nr:hypothetical protein CAC42_7330 [Sphaceloma murrayae]
MQRLQRQAGKLMKRSADGADVATVLHEFQIADQLLDSFMDAVRSFQNGWNAILTHQLGIAQQLETLYRPMHDPESKYNAESDPALLDKALHLKTTYVDLEKDLQQETAWIQAKLLQPAMDAKQSLGALKKSLKNRENYKLDYERYQSRVDHVRSKGIKGGKDEVALVKHESDLAEAAALYHGADDSIKKTFPAVVDAVQVLMPLLMNTQIMLQHALVGQLYTVLHGYCQQFQFPSPAPPMEEVVAAWDREFTPLRHEVETGLKMLSSGKAINQPMRIEEKPNTNSGLGIRSKATGMIGARKASQTNVPQAQRFSTTTSEQDDEEKGNTVTGFGIRNKATGMIGARRTSQTNVPRARRSSTATSEQEDDEEAPPPRPPRPGQGSTALANRPRIASASQVSLRSQQSVPEDEEMPPAKPPRPSGPGPIPLSSKPRTPSSASIARFQGGTPLLGMSFTPGPSDGPSGSRRSSASTTPSTYLTPAATPSEKQARPGLSPQQGGDYFGATSRSPSSSSIASSIAAKKKPPPPPVKRRTTATQELYVTALYDFPGQGDGDLAFKEGDQIKVLKKSESTDDWWLGSLRGQSGSFPANYVQMA